MSSILSFFKGTVAKLVGRALLKAAGGALLGWLLAKGVDPTQANNLVDYLSAAGTIALGLGLSWGNEKSNQGTAVVAAANAYDQAQATALQQAMQQGVTVQASADQTKIAAVAQAVTAAGAASKTDKASLVAALKAGAF